MFNIGDRVYYVDNGPTDAGTVTGLPPAAPKGWKNVYRVKWDSWIGTDLEEDWHQPFQLRRVAE